MTSWVLSCKHCKKTFPHSEVRDTLANYFFPEKPKFGAGGIEQECPHCKTKSVYQQHELRYQERWMRAI
jgi:hypothetical protein